MTNPIRMFQDFRKWRKERYTVALECMTAKIAGEKYDFGPQQGEYMAFQEGILYGIEHRKKILKQVKI